MHVPFPLVAFGAGLVVGAVDNAAARLFLQRETASHGLRACPFCTHRLAWWEYFSLADYLLHRRKCPYCGQPQLFRYSVLELSMGVWHFLLAWTFGWSSAWMVYTLVGGVCIVLSLIDLEKMILPDEMVIPGSLLAFLCAVGILKKPFLVHILGGIAGAGFFWVVQCFCLVRYKSRVIGSGDVKFMLLLGFLIGWKGVPLLIGVAFVSCSLVCSALLIDDDDFHLPFAPFLCFGLMISILFTEWVA